MDLDDLLDDIEIPDDEPVVKASAKSVVEEVDLDIELNKQLEEKVLQYNILILL
jgi:hypothetical protein